MTRSNLKAVGLFALVGPPVGALLWILSNTDTSPFPQSFLESALSSASTMAISIPISWVFGLVPAVLAGVLSALSWWLLPAHLTARRLIRVAVGTFWGYAATYGFKWLAFGLEDLPGPLTLEVLGAVSGFACAALVPNSWVSPNNSSKPTPLRGAA